MTMLQSLGTGAKRLVSQGTDITTGVTLNARFGEITTQAMSAAAGAENAFTLTNSFIGPSSIVLLNWTTASGGTPFMYAQPAATGGSAVITITNLHGANALDAAAVITFVVI